MQRCKSWLDQRFIDDLGGRKEVSEHLIANGGDYEMWLTEAPRRRLPDSMNPFEGAGWSNGVAA
jgi:hypothetical protein